MRLHTVSLTLLGLFIFTGPARSQAGGSFTIQEENDSFAASDRADRGYTNGTRLMWTWAPPQNSRIDRWIVRLCGDPSRLHCERNAVLGLGQSMYTPENIQSRRRIPGDRPYGGWLYGVLMLDAGKEEAADHVEFYGGVVGPAAQAGPVQKFVHRNVVPAPAPLGWGTQIGSWPALLLTYERRVKFAELKDVLGQPYLDLTPTLGGALGNVFDYASASATLRVGHNLPARFLRPIPSIVSVGSPDEAPRVPPPSRWDAFVFATAEVRYVARDIFIDTESEVYRIHREPFVRDRRLGASFRIGWFRLQYAHTFRSPEFRPNPRSHSYGTFMMTFGSRP